jgi:hypothetical protein
LKTAIFAVAALAAIVVAYVAGLRAGRIHEVMAAAPTEARKIAFVREEPCGDLPCQTIWIGNTREDAVQVASLTPRAERCEEIAWAKDGYRVGFVINGYQLRIFDGVSRKAINQVNLIEPDGTPTSRFVRGITFSQNGAAVTIDECPRGRSGCKSGLAAVR